MERILFVDDDPNILSAHQRNLRKQFAIETAIGGNEGLAAIEKGPPFAVVVSDMTMPGMTGVQFLSRVRDISPDSVRIMLTGNANLTTAMNAVNEGYIFRFLTKPCSPEQLCAALIAGIEQYRLITAERELLEQTLNGSVKVLTEVLSAVDPQSFGRAQTLRLLSCQFAKSQKLSSIWEVELGAMLAPVGYVTIPANVVSKERTGQPLSGIERDMLARVPAVGSRLVANIQRLEPISRVVLYQDKHFDGSGFPLDPIQGLEIPYAARVIKIFKDLLRREDEGEERKVALGKLAALPGHYDPDLLKAITAHLIQPRQSAPSRTINKRKTVHELRPGMLLISNLETSNGQLLIAAGHRITEALHERIQNYAKLTGIKEPIEIQDE